jgi:hypothetical protein
VQWLCQHGAACPARAAGHAPCGDEGKPANDLKSALYGPTLRMFNKSELYSYPF